VSNLDSPIFPSALQPDPPLHRTAGMQLAWCLSPTPAQLCPCSCPRPAVPTQLPSTGSLFPQGLSGLGRMQQQLASLSPCHPTPWTSAGEATMYSSMVCVCMCVSSEAQLVSFRVIVGPILEVLVKCLVACLYLGS
jgi:hypothetical protein